MPREQIIIGGMIVLSLTTGIRVVIPGKSSVAACLLLELPLAPAIRIHVIAAGNILILGLNLVACRFSILQPKVASGSL